MLFGWSGKLNTSRFDNIQAPATCLGIAWPSLLVWLMRILSVVWLIKGLAGWSEVLGTLGEAGAFEKASLMQQTAIVFFAVIDLIAGVGLWMLAAWGGVIWLLATAAHAFLGLFVARAVNLGTSTLLVYLCLIAAFFLITWAASHHEEG